MRPFLRRTLLVAGIIAGSLLTLGIALTAFGAVLEATGYHAPAPAPATHSAPAPVIRPTTQTPAPAPQQGITPDQADQIYLIVLHSDGIPLASDNAAITLGHAVCTGFDDGLSMETIGLTIMQSGGFSAAQAGTIEGSAVSAYCPQYTSLLGG